MDLTNGYDFTIEADRQRAWEHVTKDELYCVIGSPPCTMFSMLQELNLHKFRNNPECLARFEEAKKQAIKHI